MNAISSLFNILNTLYWNIFLLFVYLSVGSLGGLPAYLIYRFNKKSSSKTFNYYFKKITFPWGILLGIVLYAASYILFFKYYLLLFASIFVQPIIILFLLSRKLPNPPQLFTFPFEKTKNYLKNNLFNIASTIILVFLIVYVNIRVNIKLQSLQLQYNLKQMQIDSFQTAITTMLLIGIFFYLAFLKLTDFLKNQATPHIKDKIAGEISKKYNQQLEKIQKIKPSLFYPTLGLMLAFLLFLYILISDNINILMSSNSRFNLALFLAIPLSVSTIILTYKEIEKLTSFDIPSKVKNHFIKRGLIGTSLAMVIGALILISFGFLFAFFLKTYIGDIIFGVNWFPSETMSSFKETFFYFEKMYEYSNQLPKIAFWFIKFILTLGQFLVLSVILTYWSYTSFSKKGLKLLISWIAFAFVSVIAGIIFKESITNTGKILLSPLIPAVAVELGPTISDLLIQRTDTRICVECKKRNPKDVQTCIHCEHLIDKNKILGEIKQEKPQKEKINLDSIIQDIIKWKKQSTSQKGIKFRYTKTDIKTKLPGKNLLKKQLFGIIENAIIHSQGKKIKINTEKTEKEIVIKIEDDGKGIPDRDKEKIFEKGWTKDKSKNSGLGLYLVKKIAEIQGGNIKVKNSPSGGAIFEVHLKEKQE